MPGFKVLTAMLMSILGYDTKSIIK